MAKKKRVARGNAERTPGAEGHADEPKRWCATDLNHERLLRTAPGYSDTRAMVENHTWRACHLGGGAVVGRSGCTEIPVVVHVLYKTTTQNISDAQIQSQIEVLNADFRKKNADIGTIPAAFAHLADDARIQFALATEDPDGNPTTGILRVSTSRSSFPSDDSMKSAATGGSDAWPRDRYLNIWVCQLSDYLGYAQFPGGPAETDGVVIRHNYFGTTGTATAPFDGGRTATHEVGHWLNLRHIWGDDGTGCSGSDFVSDTPNQGGPNYGTPSFPTISCSNGPNGDMFMNYMDYVDDEAMVMFTKGQVTRMQATLDGARSGIGASIACGPVSITAGLTVHEATKKPTGDPSTSFTQAVPSSPGTFFTKPPEDDFTVTPKLKFLDDLGSLKFRDDGTNPFIDPIKLPGYDKHPASDWNFGGLLQTLFFRGAGAGAGGAAPFVLSTPHHSTAWTSSYPGAAQARVGQLQQEIAALQPLFGMAMQAQAAGLLGPAEQVQVAQLQATLAALQTEYAQLSGGAG